MLSRPDFTSNRRLWTGGVLACISILFSSGCGPDYKARGVVKGKITIGKKALSTGSVMFTGKNNVTASARIEPDGTYDMQDAPLGECTVTVSVPDMPRDPSVRARLKGGGPKMPGEMKNPEATGPDLPLPSGPTVPSEVVPIDAKYSKPETSGLKFKVEKGEQTYNIELQ